MKIKFIKEYRVIPSPSQLIGLIFAVGTVLDVDNSKLNDDDAQWLIDNGFAEEVKESGWWKPKLGEEYSTIKMNGKISTTIWVSDSKDEFVCSLGLCFKTKDAAERYRDYLKAIATVRQDEGVLTPEEVESAECSNGVIWGITYTYGSGLFVHTCRLAMELPQIGAIYFSSRERANASLDKHPDEWKIIANYDWSRE